MSQIDRTHDASLRSWLESANVADTSFPIQNLPFGVFGTSSGGGNVRCGVAIGDRVLDLRALEGVFYGDAQQVICASDHQELNELMALAPSVRQVFRQQLVDLLAEGNPLGRQKLETALLPATNVNMMMPVRVAGYTDFFASIHHATNAGRLFRPDQPLLPNYKYVPVGYNGRAASVQLGDVPVQRPRGQLRKPGSEVPTFLPCERLDYEVEMGIFVGCPSERGVPIQVADAWRHVFGMCLLNDWSARDIQTWEYQPLGPFLAKSFATSISAWVVTTEALTPFRVPAASRPEGDPAPLPHLFDANDQASGAVQIEIDAYLCTAQMRVKNHSAYRLSRSNAASLYWTPAQMLAHHTSNGSFLQNGDLLGTGTISGPDEFSMGSLLEISRGGQVPLQLPSGEERRFLEDGDEVTITAHCHREGFRSIGFGSCRATLLPASS